MMGLSEMYMPSDVDIIGYADDLALVIIAGNEQELIMGGNRALQRVDSQLETYNLVLPTKDYDGWKKSSLRGYIYTRKTSG